MKLASVYGYVDKTRKLLANTDWPLERCHIGLEWEFENGRYLRHNVANDRGNKYLSIHDDGSLRDAGVELTTAGDGLWGQDLTDAITFLDAHINMLPDAGNFRPVCNYRTGFHVHIDIRDLEEKELHNMLVLYCVLEYPIFEFVGKERWKSNFCVPWFRSDSQFDVLKLIGDITENTARDAADKVSRLQRYSALNCQSIAKFGTLESRHMQNDVSELLTKQKEFIRLIMKPKALAIKKAQEGLTGQELFKNLKDMDKYGLIKEFGMDLPTWGWDYPESLMHTIGLVNFKLNTKGTWFFDAIYDRFAGKHANWK